MAERLHVVQVVRSDSFAGVERSIVLSTRALVERGHRVDVIGGHPPTMKNLLASVVGVRWYAATSIFDSWWQLAKLGRVDVVHAHMTAAEVAAVAAWPRNRSALVVTRHFAQQRGISPSGRVAAAAMRRKPHLEIAISRFVADRLEFPSVIVHHGLEDQPAVERSAKRVVVIQRLEPEKSTGVALQAWATAGLQRDGWELVIAGDGQERAGLQQRCVELGIAESVKFVGRVADVDALRRTASIQLATPPGEHFGLSVLEAMAVGLPVIASDSGAHRELLGSGRPVGFFRDGDGDGAAAELRRFADDGVLRQEIGEAQQLRQRALFSLEAHGAALESAYSTIVTRPRVNLGQPQR